MLIQQPQLISIRENKPTLVKNFVTLKKKYDFNLLSQFMEENDSTVMSHSSIGNLRDVFRIPGVSGYLKEFKTFFDFLTKMFNYQRDEQDEVDLFFSFVSQSGHSHVDVEDVFIIGLEGRVIYKVFNDENKNYTVEKGDMICIPKGLKHKVIALDPRIIASVGLFGDRVKSV